MPQSNNLKLTVILKIIARITCIAMLALSANFAAAESEEYIVHLPDGTEIKIDDKQAYYRCKGKIVLLPDGAYLLADGSKLTVSHQKIVELEK